MGDGQSIKIWGDKWLSTPISFFVHSPPNIIVADSSVVALLDRDLRGWNVDLIRSIFSVEEANVITSIPIFPSFPLDRLVWWGTSNGIFSVRSAYHLGKEIAA